MIRKSLLGMMILGTMANAEVVATGLNRDSSVVKVGSKIGFKLNGLIEDNREIRRVIIRCMEKDHICSNEVLNSKMKDEVLIPAEQMKVREFLKSHKDYFVSTMNNNNTMATGYFER